MVPDGFTPNSSPVFSDPAVAVRILLSNESCLNFAISVLH